MKEVSAAMACRTMLSVCMLIRMDESILFTADTFGHDAENLHDIFFGREPESLQVGRHHDECALKATGSLDLGVLFQSCEIGILGNTRITTIHAADSDRIPIEVFASLYTRIEMESSSDEGKCPMINTIFGDDIDGWTGEIRLVGHE